MAPSQTDIPAIYFGLETDQVQIPYFTAISGMEMTFDAFEYQEGGNNGFVHRLPGAVRHPNVSLSRSLTTDKTLFQWVQDTQKAAKTCNLSITMFDSGGEQLFKWVFSDAFPIRWSGPHIEANGAYVAIETVEITHTGMTAE